MELVVSKKTIGIVIMVIVFLGGFVAFAKAPGAPQQTPQVKGENAVVLNVLAKAGYYPEILSAPANKTVILRVETKNTYDCSAAFSIPAISVDTILPANGYTDFTLPPQAAGKVITAGCSMGMYGMQIKYQ